MTNFIIELFHHFMDNINYLSIYIFMSIESSFIPFPSEIILIPAGYLAFSGKLNIYAITLVSTMGSITGALINYYLALKLGMPFILKYKKYFFIKDKHIEKFDRFFNSHAIIATFNGRLIPAIRQLISIPAGAVKMNLLSFIIATFAGSIIWNAILIILGYVLKDNIKLIDKYKLEASIFVILFVIIVMLIYIYIRRIKNGTNHKS